MLKRIGSESPTRPQVINYIDWMHSKNYSYSYIHNSIRSAELYMEFIGKQIRLGRMRKPKTIIKETLTEAEVVSMFHHTKNIREQAILAVLSYSGLRNKEICDLKLGNIDFGNNTIQVLKGKGVKDGICYVSPECTRILIKYLERFPREEDKYLFTTLLRGNQYGGSDLRKFTKIIARRAGVTKRVHPHLFRHSLATNMINRGAGIFTIKEQLRHSLIETSLHYIQSLPYGTRTEYQKYAPCYC